MPELPEVETVCRKLRPSVTGRKVRSVRVYRCGSPELETAAPGRRIESVERRAKHILLRLSGGGAVHAHLRMSGNLFAIPDHRLHGAAARVVIALSGGAGIVLEDPRALAWMDFLGPEQTARLLDSLGVEPLSEEFSAARFAELARGSRQPVKLFLMDQARVAGLGNIYAAEALFRARVDPRKPVGRLRRQRLDAIHRAIREVLAGAVESAARAYGGPGEFAGAESFPLAVYGREGEDCPRCGKAVRRIAQGGRSTYFCGVCQR